MKKRGISTIIATVLTILITVASVVILWASVQPIISKSNFVDPLDVSFSIDKKNSFTFYDSDTGYLSVKITRGADDNDPEVLALKFVINIDGNTVSRKTYQVMGPNQGQVYFFLVGFYDEIESVKVVPVFLVEGEEVEGQAFYIEQKIPLSPGKLENKLDDLKVEKDLDDPLTDGLVFYYSFDEDFVNGDTVLDQSGEGHNGEIVGATQILDDPERGNVMSFDGTNDHIIVGNGDHLAEITGKDKTITFWANFNCPTNIDAPFGSYNNYNINFLDPCSSGIMDIGYDSFGNSANPVISSSSGDNWEFYVIVFEKISGSNNDRITVYKNNDPAVLSTGFEIGNSVDPNFFVGTISGNLAGDPDNTYFLGHLDDLRIYNRTLSDSEIDQIRSFVN